MLQRFRTMFSAVLMLTVIAGPASMLGVTSAEANTLREMKVVRIAAPDNEDGARPCTFVKFQFLSSGLVTNWYAVSNTHIGYKEMVVILHNALLFDKSVDVIGTGGFVCGEKEIDNVWLYSN